MFISHIGLYTFKALAFACGWLADRIFGDPSNIPHPIVYFGKWISLGEKEWNKGDNRAFKGAFFSIVSIIGIYLGVEYILKEAAHISSALSFILIAIGVFYFLAGKTLISEVKNVFIALDRSLDEGRRQVGRIVGRDTSNLSRQEIQAAALETLAENLSDGVIAPMFWFALLGLPGMAAYKMINTLDSMIGYKNERYAEFGQIAARIDDLANYIPARLTAWLMLIVSGNINKWDFINRFGSAHASPNSGYPEAALAAILDCQFGGTHDYFGEPVEKPYIGTNRRQFVYKDMEIAIGINNKTELAMGFLVCLISIFIH